MLKEGLSALQLAEALQNHPVTQPFFAGVYASDQVVNAPAHSPPYLIMVNTDPHYAPGTHWLLFFFLNKHQVEMFDSLGKDLSHYPTSLTQWLYHQQVQEIDRMTQRVQPQDSALCGHYCLYYAYCRCHGQKMAHIVQHLPSPQWIENCIPILFDITPIFNPECQHCIKL